MSVGTEKTAAVAATSSERTTPASGPERIGLTAPSRVGQEWNGSMVQPGSVLAERYQIMRLIARGGMGEVYEAHDLAREKLIALKILTHCDDDSDAAQQLRAEVELAHRVTHKYVCRTFDLGVHRGESNAQVLFITMELINGRSLSQHLRSAGPLTPVDACRVGLRILKGLEAAHDAGVLHRDLKSDNLMLRDSADGELVPVIMDFGLSKNLSTGSTSGNGEEALAGTLAYLAPEQLQGKCPRVTTDLYAFGLVMFEMLTAKLPFAAATPALEALKRLQEPAPSVLQFSVGVSSQLARFVAQCLERDPSKRFPSARVAREQLVLVPELIDVGYRTTLGAIEGSYVSTTKSSPGTSRKRLSNTWRLSLSALVAVVLASLATTWRRPSATVAPDQGTHPAHPAAELVTDAPTALVAPSPSESAAERSSPADMHPLSPSTRDVQPETRSVPVATSKPKTARAARPSATPARVATSSRVGGSELAERSKQLVQPTSAPPAPRQCPPGMLCPGRSADSD